MDLTPYVAGLRDDLTAAASAGDEHTRGTAAALAAAIEPAARIAIMNALSDLAAEVTAGLDGQVVQLQLDGRDVRVVVTSPAAGPSAEESGLGGNAAAGDISRITLRLFEQIKGQAERAAADQGVSLNTWVSQAVQGALRQNDPWGETRGRGHQAGGGQRHVRGWVQG